MYLKTLYYSKIKYGIAYFEKKIYNADIGGGKMQNELVKHCYKSQLNYQVHYVSGTNVNAAYSAQLHYDTDLTVAYFKKARGTIKIEGNSYKLTSGDIIILNYNELHCVDLQNEFCERITLYLNESIYRSYSKPVNELLNIFYNRKRGAGNLIPASVVTAQGMDALMEEIREHSAQQDPVSEIVAFGRITELLKQLNQTAVEHGESENKIYSNTPIVEQVIKYISQHFAEDITCDSIADQMYLNKYYLGRLFKEAVGISLWDYIINRRLLHFNDLVRQDYPIEEACSKSGFRNYSNFYRLYKKRMGISPQEFKRSVLKNSVL